MFLSFSGLSIKQKRIVSSQIRRLGRNDKARIGEFQGSRMSGGIFAVNQKAFEMFRADNAQRQSAAYGLFHRLRSVNGHQLQQVAQLKADGAPSSCQKFQVSPGLGSESFDGFDVGVRLGARFCLEESFL